MALETQKVVPDDGAAAQEDQVTGYLAHKWGLESRFGATVSQKRPDPGKQKKGSQNSKTPEKKREKTQP